MSYTVTINYEQIYVQCEALCDVSEQRIKDLIELRSKALASSSDIVNNDVMNVVKLIDKEIKKLRDSIDDVVSIAKKDVSKGSVSVSNHSHAYETRDVLINRAKMLQSEVNTVASTTLNELQSALKLALVNNINEHNELFKSNSSGYITLPSNIQKIIDGIKDGITAHFTYLAYLNDTNLSGESLLEAGKKLKIEETEKTCEEKLLEQTAKIRSELESMKIDKSVIDEVLVSNSTKASEKLKEVREKATNEIIGEQLRKKTLSFIVNAIKKRGFVVDNKNIKIQKETNEVVVVALKPSGEKAEFRVFVDGKFIYDFKGYEGQACQNDIQPFMDDLENIYGVKVVEQHEIWKNPDKNQTMKYQAMNNNKNKG